ncbi:2-keto-3-deoxygluconate permease [Escherichia coli]|uniref:2-keto-3-deoxygluconate permease n=1 Tax=Escherichia coli TaxID=562 RepID=UPI002022B924|nr:2-keto-3-deoxygluconate permease [Escherichia coli]
MISLSPPTICNSAAEAAPAATTLVASCVVITAIVVPVITALWAKHGASRVRAT